MKKKKSDLSNYFRYIKIFWTIFICSLLTIGLIFLLASWSFFGTMPTFEELENPSSNLATEIISSDGITLGKFYNENRTPVSFSDLSEPIVKALIATEDERFLQHSGIDFRSTLRAAISLGTSGGASTLSQQLAKLLFHGEGSRNIMARLIQKFKEWIIAIRLEKQYTKEEILTMYLNKADFINTAVGIRSASTVYFSKESSDLTISEAAMLIGMLKNPSLFNPISREELVKKRRNVVLKQMEKNKFISTKLKEELQSEPLNLRFSPENNNEGVATYFREYLRDFMKQWVKKNKKPDGSEYNIYRDGLKIYITIDYKMQQYAEEAVTEHLKNLQEEFFEQNKKNKNAPFINLSEDETNRILYRAMKSSIRWKVMKEQNINDENIIKSFHKKTKMRIFSWNGEKDTIMTPIDSIRYYKSFLQAGMMAMEPQTGFVKVWVGGINHKYFKYDHVQQGARQVGSTFKPFLYATAIDQLHYSPCDSIMDSPFTIPIGKHNVTNKDWTPKNSNGQYKGMVTLKAALANSINTISAKLIDRIGPQAVVNMSHDLGITADIPVTPSIALGAVEITVSEMVAGYSTFANQGIYIKPQIITRIENKKGAVIYEPIPVSRDVVNKEVSYTIIKLLEGVTQMGSGTRLRTTNASGTFYKRVTGHPYKFQNPIAGKTGTTQNQSDGWFVGMVPNLATGVWVGNEDRAAHFRTLAYGQGATMALPIWGIFMRKCYADKKLNVSTEPFQRPENISINVDCWKKENDIEDDDYSLDQFNF